MSTLDARLDELAALSDGWLDGEGLALTPHAIATARAVLGRLAAEHPDVPRPRVYPTPDGEVSAEWTLGRVSADVRFPAAGLALDADALHVDTGAEIALTIDGGAPDAPAQIAAWLRAAAPASMSTTPCDRCGASPSDDCAVWCRGPGENR